MKRILLFLSLLTATIAFGQTFNSYTTSSSGICGNNVYTTEFINGEVWLGTHSLGDGVSRFDGNTTWTTYNTSNSGLPDNNVGDIVADGNGNIWFATNNGLAKFDGTSWSSFTTSNSSIQSDGLFSVAVDANDTIWIGSLAGLIKFDGNSSFTVYDTTNSGMGGQYAMVVEIDNNNDIWVAHSNTGISHFNRSTWTNYDTLNSGLPGMDARDFFFDTNGNVWVATYDGGLGIFDGTNWTVYDETNSGMEMRSTSSVYVTGSGVAYIGTSDWYPGLMIWDGSTWSFKDYMNSGLPYGSIEDFAHGNGNENWLACFPAGLVKLTDNATSIETVITAEVSVFPNPATEKVFIETKNIREGALVQITDLNGKMIRSTYINPSGRTEINTDMSPGLYLLKIGDGERSIIRKIVKVETTH